MLLRKIKRIPYRTLNSSGVSFSRSSSAYDANGNFYNSGQPRIIPGQGILMEEGTTNIIKNPCSALNLNEITYGNASAPDVSFERVPEGIFSGYAVKVTRTVNGVPSGHTYLSNFAVQWNTNGMSVSGATMTATAWIKPSKPGMGIRIQLQRLGGDYQVFFNKIVPATTDWYKISVTNTFNTSSTQPCYVRLNFDDENSFTGDYFLVAGVQVEQKPYSTTFANGTRVEEFITIPSSVFNRTEGTITAIVSFNDVSSAHHSPIITFGGEPGTSRMLIIRDNNGTFRVWDYDETDVVLETFLIAEANTWYTVTYTWSTTAGRKIYVNGVLKANDITKTFLMADPGANSVYIGKWLGYNLNGIVKNVYIHNRALSDAEVQALVSGIVPARSSIKFAMKF